MIVANDLPRLIEGYLADHLADEDRDRLTAWVSTGPDEARLFTEQVRLHLVLATLVTLEDPDHQERTFRRGRLIAGAFTRERRRQVIDSARKLRAPQRRPRRWWLVSLLASAAIAAGLAMAFFGPQINPPPAQLRLITPVADGTVDLDQGRFSTRSAPGCILGFSDDASRITLDRNTTVNLRPGPGKQMLLAEGRIQVEAAPQPPRHPLVIGTTQANLTVIGTKFTVTAQPLVTWLQVDHGLVRVAQGGDPNPDGSARPSIDVAAGQALLATTELYPVTSPGGGLLGIYFNDLEFRSPRYARLDPQIDFDWGDRSPAPGIRDEQFTVRWTGEITAPTAGNYEFFMPRDDGAQLWIDGELVLNLWGTSAFNPEETVHGTHRFDASRLRQPIKIQFMELQKLAAIRLLWSGPGLPRQVVARNFLSPTVPIP